MQMVAESEKASSAHGSKSGKAKVHFNPIVKLRLIHENNSKKRSKDRNIEYPPGSHFHIPPYRKSSDTNKKSTSKFVKSKVSSTCKTSLPTQPIISEKPSKSSDASKLRSTDVVDSVSVEFEDKKSLDAFPGLYVDVETGESFEMAKDKKKEPDQSQEDNTV